MASRTDYHREYARKRRKAAIEHYGGCCACCGESQYEFLALDHVDGGGNQHRREMGTTGGGRIINWIHSNGFPEGFRVLCHNCNSALGYYGHCPHDS
jgi:hypothetical protein